MKLIFVSVWHFESMICKLFDGLIFAKEARPSGQRDWLNILLDIYEIIDEEHGAFWSVKLRSWRFAVILCHYDDILFR